MVVCMYVCIYVYVGLVFGLVYMVYNMGDEMIGMGWRGNEYIGTNTSIWFV